jgi:hypothetical protein
MADWRAGCLGYHSLNVKRFRTGSSMIAKAF